MSIPLVDSWPWLTLAGLGAFHGLNPAMGWLFAVALGLHRQDRAIVWLAPLPIALGHAVAVGVAAAAFVWAGATIRLDALRVGAGLCLIAWTLYHWRYGHRHRVRFGMQAGLAGLGIWSFLMASAHGAGLMLWPALVPLCVSAAAQPAGPGPASTALLAVGLHSLATLVVTAMVALAIYEWVGIAILRRAWINADLVWTFGLAAAGAFLLYS